MIINKECFIRTIKKHPKLYKLIVKVSDKLQRSINKRKLIRFFYCLLFGKTIVRKECISVWNYIEQYNIPYTKMSINDNRVICIPEFYGYDFPPNLLQVKTPMIYQTVLKNIHLLPSNNYVYNEGLFLNDKLLLDFCDEIEFKVWPVISYKNRIVEAIVSKQETVFPKAISLLGEASNNYYHWVFDLMAKMAYINNYPELFDVPILVDETVFRHSTCMNLLNDLNTHNHRIEKVSRNANILVKELFYFSPVTWSSAFYKNEKQMRSVLERYAKDDFSMDYIRKLLFKKTEICDSEVVEKIFISRGEGRKKRLVNEDELANLAAEKGFKIIDPSEFSIYEQIVLFSNAKYIIGDEGAAFVNLLFCKEGTKVACIIPGILNDYNYSTIAYYSKVDCTYVNAELTNEDLTHYLEPLVFEQFLTNWLED